MTLAESVFVEENASLSDGDENEGGSLKNPMDRDSILVVERLGEEIVVRHTQDSVRHEDEILRNKS